MDISIPNEHGWLDASYTEIVAKEGYSRAEVRIAFSEDDRFCFAVSLSYSLGGFGGPIGVDGDGFATSHAAIEAGMAKLHRRWPKPFPSDPQSVFEELARMRSQIESRLRQPSLF